VLGEGDFGLVLEVSCDLCPLIEHNHERGKTYAMKLQFHVEQHDDQAIQDGAYAHEQRMLELLLPHPNIVSLVGAFVGAIPDSLLPYIPDWAQTLATHEHGGSRVMQFIVMERLHMTLADYLEQHHPLSPQAISRIIVQVGSALLHMQRHLIVHRDLKLENILLELDHDEGRDSDIKRCVVIDLGSSCTLSTNMIELATIDSRGVVTSRRWGNQPHIAPELLIALTRALADDTVTEVALDYSKQVVYELGVLGFEIINRQQPIDGYPYRRTDRVTNEVVYSDAAIASIPNDRITASQAELLTRAVSFDATQRPSLEELIDAFRGSQV